MELPAIQDSLLLTLLGVLVGGVIGGIFTYIVANHYHKKTVGDKKEQKKKRGASFKEGATKEQSKLERLFAIFHMSGNETTFLLHGIDAPGSPATFVVLDDEGVRVVTCGKLTPNSKIARLHGLIKDGKITCELAETRIPDEIKIDRVDSGIRRSAQDA